MSFTLLPRLAVVLSFLLHTSVLSSDIGLCLILLLFSVTWFLWRLSLRFLCLSLSVGVLVLLSFSDPVLSSFTRGRLSLDQRPQNLLLRWHTTPFRSRFLARRVDGCKERKEQNLLGLPFLLSLFFASFNLSAFSRETHPRGMTTTMVDVNPGKKKMKTFFGQVCGSVTITRRRKKKPSFLFLGTERSLP